jgi:hypothetical protein
MAFLGRYVFIGQQNTTVARVDSATNCIDALVYLGAGQAASGSFANQESLLAGPEGLYVAFDVGALALIDPSTMSVRESMRVDSQDFITGITAGFGSIWYPTFGGNSVIRIRPLAAA